MTAPNLKTNLRSRRPLFWDINEKDIDRALIESDEWVIPRVFEYGSLDDIRDVIQLYGSDRVKAVLGTLKLNAMSRAMAFLFLDMDPEKRYAQ